MGPRWETKIRRARYQDARGKGLGWRYVRQHNTHNRGRIVTQARRTRSTRPASLTLGPCETKKVFESEKSAQTKRGRDRNNPGVPFTGNARSKVRNVVEIRMQVTDIGEPINEKRTMGLTSCWTGARALAVGLVQPTGTAGATQATIELCEVGSPPRRGPAITHAQR